MEENEQTNSYTGVGAKSPEERTDSLTVRLIITGPSGTAVIRMKVAQEAIIWDSDL